LFAFSSVIPDATCKPQLSPFAFQSPPSFSHIIHSPLPRLNATNNTNITHIQESSSADRTTKKLELESGVSRVYHVEEDTSEEHCLWLKIYLYIFFFPIYMDVEKRNALKEMHQADT